jgi:hypothetical protein
LDKRGDAYNFLNVTNFATSLSFIVWKRLIYREDGNVKKLVMILVAGAVLVVVAAVSLGSTAVNADATCKTVNGHITSEVVEAFPNGDECPPLGDLPGLCTVGKFIGGIKGDFRFYATAIIPNPDSAEVVSSTGKIELETKDGTLMLDDASAVSFGADGLFASVQSVDPEESDGDFSGATGRLRAYGVFQGGCVDCDYRGEICTE